MCSLVTWFTRSSSARAEQTRLLKEISDHTGEAVGASRVVAEELSQSRSEEQRARREEKLSRRAMVVLAVLMMMVTVPGAWLAIRLLNAQTPDAVAGDSSRGSSKHWPPRPRVATATAAPTTTVPPIIQILDPVDPNSDGDEDRPAPPAPGPTPTTTPSSFGPLYSGPLVPATTELSGFTATNTDYNNADMTGSSSGPFLDAAQVGIPDVKLDPGSHELELCGARVEMGSYSPMPAATGYQYGPTPGPTGQPPDPVTDRLLTIAFRYEAAVSTQLLQDLTKALAHCGYVTPSAGQLAIDTGPVGGDNVHKHIRVRYEANVILICAGLGSFDRLQQVVSDTCSKKADAVRAALR